MLEGWGAGVESMVWGNLEAEVQGGWWRSPMMEGGARLNERVRESGIESGRGKG